MINSVTDINSDDLPTKVFPYPVPLEQSVLRALPVMRTDETDGLECPVWTSQLYYEQSYTDVNDDMGTDLPESLAPMLKSMTVFEWPCVNSSLLPLKPGIANQADVTCDMDTDPPENSAPMIDSDLSIVNWEDRFYRQSGCCGGDSHDIMNTDRADPDVWKRMETPSERWSNTNDNSDTDSVAELEYKTWDDACTWEFHNALGNVPPGLIQNPPTDIIRYYETDDNSDTDSVAELEYKAGEDAACAWKCWSAPANIPPGLIQNPPTDIIRMYETVDNSDTDSAAELEYKALEDTCAWKCQNVPANYSAGISSESADGHNADLHRE